MMEQNRKPKENIPWSMEFAVPGKNIIKFLKKRVTRVKELFKVDVIFSNSFQRGDMEMQWINFMGGDATADEMKSAKTYIVSMTNPEACICVDNFSSTLFESSVDEIETSTSAFLTFKNGSVQIKGSELAVVLAQSMLESFQQDDTTEEELSTDENQSASHPPSSTVQPTRTTFHNPHNLSQQPSVSSAATAVSRSPTSMFSSSPGSETTLVKRLDSRTSYLPIVTASSHRFDEADGKIMWSNNNNDFETRDRTAYQQEYLRNVGFSHAYDVKVIEQGLKQCDMTDVIVPIQFLEILKQIQSTHKGSSSDYPSNYKNSVPVSSDTHVSSLPSSAAADLEGSYIIIDSAAEEDSGDDDIVIISSDDDSETNETQFQKTVKSKTNKKRQKKKVAESLRPLENLPQTRPLPQTQPLPQPNKKHIPGSSFLGQAPALTRPSLPRPAPRMTGPSLMGQVPSTTRPKHPKRLRYIVIDGNNVAMAHGENKVYSVKGIQICINYFVSRGHKVTVFVPESRRYSNNHIRIIGKQLLEKLNQDGHLKFTPARRITTGRIIASYDDRFILNLAEAEQGIVVSNDQYRDLLYTKPSYKEIIETRLLQFTFVGDHFMPPDDPLGRDGPSLEDFLCLPGLPTGPPANDPFSFPRGGKRGCPDRFQGASGQEGQAWQHQEGQTGQEGHAGQAWQHREAQMGHAGQAWQHRGAQTGHAGQAWQHQEAQTGHAWQHREGQTGPAGQAWQHREAQSGHAGQAWQYQEAWEKEKQKEKNNWPMRDDRDLASLLHSDELNFRSIPPTDSRTERQMKELYSQLSLMFPDPKQQPQLRRILENHPNEVDVTRLSNYVLNALSVD